MSKKIPDVFTEPQILDDIPCMSRRNASRGAEHHDLVRDVEELKEMVHMLWFMPGAPGFIQAQTEYEQQTKSIIRPPPA